MEYLDLCVTQSELEQFMADTGRTWNDLRYMTFEELNEKCKEWLKNMKAKCIKADPLRLLTVGREYKYTVYGNNVIINGTGFVLSKENFNKMFETV